MGAIMKTNTKIEQPKQTKFRQHTKIQYLREKQSQEITVAGGTPFFYRYSLVNLCEIALNQNHPNFVCL